MSFISGWKINKKKNSGKTVSPGNQTVTRFPFFSCILSPLEWFDKPSIMLKGTLDVYKRQENQSYVMRSTFSSRPWVTICPRPGIADPRRFLHGTGPRLSPSCLLYTSIFLHSITFSMYKRYYGLKNNAAMCLQGFPVQVVLAGVMLPV